ncbi:uncharacterized protein LOC134817040 [Bolinopsis microptera]|uniref:uncharacterized protein LOC134817040 n=1 Tax=Bolinopsis microptera TaxID=2820187 RepID=UPI00307ADC0F
MVHKERCVCEICSCGKHHCGPQNKFKSTGKLDLKSQGDIYVASKASFEFPDTLNLFEGGQQHTTIVRGDYKGQLNADISRPKPADQIELSSAKMGGLTSTNVQFPAYDMSLKVTSEDVKKTSASIGVRSDGTTDVSAAAAMKVSTTTSYADHYPGKNVKFEKSVAAVHHDELKGPSGELELSTVNKSDYVTFKYGRPHLNTIPDNNLFGVSDKDHSSKRTTAREHFPGFKSEPAKQIKAEENGIEFGSADRTKTSVYGEDFTQTAPKVRKSKRRGTGVDFGADFDHVTSYGTQFESKSGGKGKLASFDDELTLFSGKQDLTTIARADYKAKGHDKVGVFRHKPKDQIEIPSDKMTMDTVTLGHFQVPVVTADIVADVKSAGKAALSSTKAFDVTKSMANVKMSSDTSYKQQFETKKLVKVEKFSYQDELKGPSGELDLSTVNKSDYVTFKYGRPYLNTIPDNNLFGVSDKDHSSKRTTAREHFPGFKSEPAKQIKAEENGIEFGSADRTKTSVYGEDFTQTAPKVRKSKRRGTGVDFGADFDHVTSYGTQFESKSGGKGELASFDDELTLFSGKQDLTTIARADYKAKGHEKVGVFRHKPKDQIEIPSDAMTMDTVTLGHFQVPVVTADIVADVKSAGKAALSSTKAFDVTKSMANVKMSSDTSYKQQFETKKLVKVEKFSYQDEILASTGEIDLATLNKSDYTKHGYGRPQIHKTKDNNIFGINYDLGKVGLETEDVDEYGLDGISVSRGSVGVVQAAAVDMEVESLPSSRRSSAGITVGVDKVAKFKSAPAKAKGDLADQTSYAGHFKATDGKMRSSKKTDATVSFGRDFYAGTSYADHYKTKTCLVPTLDKLDEYTFKNLQAGHRIYSINCGCPPVGACGCTPPPTATSVKAG